MNSVRSSIMKTKESGGQKQSKMEIQEVTTIRNLRDLGGIVNKEGKAIKDKCLFRSAYFNRASKEDTDLLYDKYNLHTIVDLRTYTEVAEQPDLNGRIRHVHMPVIEDFMDGITHEENRKYNYPDMAEMYKFIVSSPRQIENFRKIMNFIMDNNYEEGGVLWHCSEGKDRCGLVTVLTLMALDVDREKIVKDYLLTNQYNAEKAKSMYEYALSHADEKTAQRVYQAFVADEKYLNSAFEAMGDDYLYQVLKLDKEKVDNFKNKVLQ